MYSPFESGMLSGTARVFDHQIPGGQYSNLLVQCASMGLADRWEEVLDAYRDVNLLLGDIVKVTPSSKCVGDMALFLVTRNMRAQDVLNPAGSAVDWPDSVVGLLRGELGWPHRGFPHAVQETILRGRSCVTGRPGQLLPAADLNENIRQLSERFGTPVSAERAMSSLMYPKVNDTFVY
jgi:pyruvate carboxylase